MFYRNYALGKGWKKVQAVKSTLFHMGLLAMSELLDAEPVVRFALFIGAILLSLILCVLILR